MKKLIITALGIAALCCCAKEENEASINDNKNPEAQETVVPAAGPGIIRCVVPQMPVTSTAISGSDPYNVVWLSGDEMKVYGENFTNGVVYTTSSEGDDVVFSAAEGVTDGTRYAVYPAAAAGAISEGKIPVSLASFRSYDYHSTIPYYGDNSNYNSGLDKAYYEAHSIFPHLPLYASSDDENFVFSNLFGGLKVNLNDYQGNAIKVSSIKLTADKYVSGTMNIASDGTFTLSGTTDAEKTVEVTYPSGVKISPSNYSTTSPGLSEDRVYGKFYFFLPATSYNSLSFEITDTLGRKYTMATSGAVTVEPGIIKTFPTLELTLYYGTTNCYQTTTGQTVDIDITPYYTFDSRLRRNGSVVEGTLPQLTAEVLWELKTDSDALNAGDIISDPPSIVGNTMSVTVGSNTGNAVVAVKNGGDVMWSWHIWVTEDAPADLHYAIGEDDFYMMDRDLGAVWAPTLTTRSASLAYKTYGMMYQWGRKDPLPTYGVSAYGTSSKALFDTYVDQRAYVKMCLNKPLEKITQKLAGDAYLYPTTVQNYLYWGCPADYTPASPESMPPLPKDDNFVKTVYDPCPAGYMVPQSYHYSGVHNAGTVSGVNCNARQGYVDWFIMNNKLAGSASASDLTFFNLRGVFSAANNVVSGTTEVTSNGVYSNYWTSTPYGGGWAGSVFQPKYSKVESSNVAWIDWAGLSAVATCSVRCLKQ